jgi:hypothetical protein
MFCLSCFCVVMSCGGRSPASGRSPVQGVLPNLQLIHNFGSNSEFERVTRSDDDDDEMYCDQTFLLSSDFH